MQVREVLQKALEAFGPNGENWAKGMEALDRPKCCVTLAFSGVRGDTSEALNFFLKCSGFGEGYRSIQTAELWNDIPERTWPEVKELFEKAIESAPGTDRYEVRG